MDACRRAVRQAAGRRSRSSPARCCSCMMLVICADVLLRNVRIVPGMRGIAVGQRPVGGMPLPHHAARRRRGCCARASTSASTSCCARSRRASAWYCEWLVDLLGLACCAGDRVVRRRAPRSTAMQVRRDVRSRRWSTPEWWWLALLPLTFVAAGDRVRCSACSASRWASARRATKRCRRHEAMSWQAAAWLLLGGSTVLLFLGLPVAFSFLVINVRRRVAHPRRRGRHRAAGAQLRRLGGELLAHADPAVHPDGRGAVPHRPGGQGDRRHRAPDPRRCRAGWRWWRWSPARSSRRSRARPSPPRRCSAA